MRRCGRTMAASPLLGLVPLNRADGQACRCDALPGATSSCAQHITGASRADDPAGNSVDRLLQPTHRRAVVAWYKRRLPDAQHRSEGLENIWRLLPAEPQPSYPSPPCRFQGARRLPHTVPTKARTSHGVDDDAPYRRRRQPRRPVRPARARLRSAAVSRHRSLEDGPARGCCRQRDGDIARAATSIDVPASRRAAPRATPPDPNWRETPAANGDSTSCRREGSVLIVSTKNELRYIHHHYRLRR